MNPRPDRDDLLDAILAESVPADFHGALLADTLRRARHKRWARRAGRAALAAAAACAIGLLMWRSAPRNSRTIPTAASFTLVRTQQLPSSAMVRTQPLGADSVVTFAGVGVVRTSSDAEIFRVINDDELLALAAPRIPALRRTGPHTQELILLAPRDSDARPVN